MSKSKSFRSSIFSALSLSLALSLALGALALPGGSASAQTHGGKSSDLTQVSIDKNRYEKRTHLDFDDDEVEGSFPRPDDLQILSVTKGRHDSLVRARLSFLPELVKSVEAQ